MEPSEKIARIQQRMAELGISPSNAVPPLWKLLWQSGVDIPPPLFMGFGSIALLMGGFFGVFWGLLMWVIMWSRQGMPTWLVLAAAAMAGVLFGLCMAAYFRHLARRHKLPSWAEFNAGL